MTCMHDVFLCDSCMSRKIAIVGCTSYLGIGDVYMEVIGKDMTCISIPMSRDWKRDVIWFTS